MQRAVAYQRFTILIRIWFKVIEKKTSNIINRNLFARNVTFMAFFLPVALVYCLLFAVFYAAISFLHLLALSRLFRVIILFQPSHDLPPGWQMNGREESKRRKK